MMQWFFLKIAPLPHVFALKFVAQPVIHTLAMFLRARVMTCQQMSAGALTLLHYTLRKRNNG
jgi:hypothetical protein